MVKYILPIVILFFLCLMWEGLVALFPAWKLAVAAPLEIVACLMERSDRFLHHTWITVQEMLSGGALAFVIAFPLAWLMALNKSARNVLQPLFLVIQSIPMFALAPIMVIWFDWSRLAIIIPTALMIFFPLTMTLYRGILTVPIHLLEYFKLQKATRFQLFFKLQLPWSLPFIFSGLRICSAIAGIGAVAGEWAGGQEGLGIMMLESRRGADLPMAFGALFCLAAVGFALYGFTSFAERLSKKGKAPFAGLGMAFVVFAIALCNPAEEPPKVRLILDWLPNPNHIPLYVGVQKGFFSTRGIHLNIQKLHDGASNLPYLASGQTDLAVSYMTSTIRALEKKLPLEPIAVLIDSPLNSILYLKDSGVTTFQDLSGKKIGYCIDGTTTRYLQTLLNHNNIVPLELRNVSFDLVSTLGGKKVDAVYGAYWNIETEFLRSFGIEVGHFTVKDLGVPECYELVILGKKGLTEEFVENFKKGLQESIDWCIKNPHEAFETYAKVHPDKGDKTKVWEERAWMNTLQVLAKDQKIDYQKLMNFRSFMEENGLL